MAGNPNWWNMHPPSLNIPPQYMLGSSSIPFNSLTENSEVPPQSWSQLLFTGVPGEEERLGFNHFEPKNSENWDVQILNPSSRVPIMDVRKEKLGDRITALHQLVSPFGKTDTASVLLEAIGYIRFLQSQIEALSSPYLDTAASKNMMRNQHSVHVERNSVFPEDPGQLLDDSGLKRKGAPIPNQNAEANKAKDLRSRGLCLVPVSCTQHVGSENGADYWAPAFGNGF
ncbi:hypothetical protein TSUD_112660 [Trifolium subterraneum]|uniref:BHLH domain-containing protein n=1 Tax=Trifolium subterraneum TaxID=3900 RepID=A0A2Z6LJG6_TRISU|nr:hypothetical protein TSUD_112660 [Trifolium subterraneum]